jgi:hypothetical protein
MTNLGSTKKLQLLLYLPTTTRRDKTTEVQPIAEKEQSITRLQSGYLNILAVGIDILSKRCA